MKVSLVIPVYNEAGHLAEFLRQVDSLVLEGVEKELVIIDDCSQDESRSILQNFQFSCATQLHFQEVNQGTGAAIRKGVELATGDIIGIQDADFEYSMDQDETGTFCSLFFSSLRDVQRLTQLSRSVFVAADELVRKLDA